jgi:predicted urease superfamily metal-dependent hydrolase
MFTVVRVSLILWAFSKRASGMQRKTVCQRTNLIAQRLSTIADIAAKMYMPIRIHNSSPESEKYLANTIYSTHNSVGIVLHHHTAPLVPKSHNTSNY